jgi:hypothetical protein
MLFHIHKIASLSSPKFFISSSSSAYLLMPNLLANSDNNCVSDSFATADLPLVMEQG